MKETKSQVKWEDLETLQSEIIAIADKVRDLRETVSTAITVVGEDFRDAKYDEFVDAYEQYKNEMEKISEEYDHYAKDILLPFIEHGKEYDAIKPTIV